MPASAVATRVGSILTLAVVAVAATAISSGGSAVASAHAATTQQPTAGSVRAFDPGSIAGLTLWFRPESLSDHADGDPVVVWPDSSSSRLPAVQPAAAKQPIYHTGRFNGAPVVQFDGAQDVLMLTGSRVLNNISLFIVYRYQAGVTDGCTQTYPFGLGGDQNITGTYWGIETLDDCSARSPNIADIYAGFSNDARATYPGISAANKITLLDAISAGSSHHTAVFVNGTAAAMSGTGSDVQLAVPIAGELGVSWGGIGGSTFPGDNKTAKAEIAEILVYDSALGSTQRQQVESYLEAKYGIGSAQPLAVPVDVRPDQCPNQLDLSSREDLAVAIAGTSTFDPRLVVPASVRLDGVAPLRWSVEDVTVPYRPYLGKKRRRDCTLGHPDGIDDLKLKFSIADLANTLPTANGVTVLPLTGALKDGTPITGEDVVVVTPATSGGAMPLTIPLNDFNHCALDFHFPAAQLMFNAIPFRVDPATNPKALAAGAGATQCVTTAIDAAVIPVGHPGSRLWLLAAADNDLPFPNTLFATTIHYTDGSTTSANVRERESGGTGLIEFSSWGRNGRPDLAVYGAPAHDSSGNSGSAFVYMFFVDLDPQKTARDVTITAPATNNGAYIYAATLATTPSLTRGLVSRWEAEGDAHDSADGNDGTLRRGASFAPGRIGAEAFAFDGINDDVAVPRAPNLDPGAQASIAFWMNADADTPMDVCCEGLVATDMYHVEIGGLGVNFFISPDGGVSFPHTAGAIVSQGVWHHVAGTYDGTKLQLYIDGKPFGNPTFQTGVISPMRPTSYVGFGSEDGRMTCGFCHGNRYFKGKLDDIRIYDRALTAAEVKLLAAGTVTSG